MSCGYGNFSNRDDLTNQVLGTTFSTTYKSVWLYTAYLGRVNVKVGVTGDPNKVRMECKGVGSFSDIVVREVDIVKSNIDINSRPILRQLSSKQPAEVDVAKNKENFFLIQKLEAQKAVRDRDQDGITLRQKSLDKFSLLEPELNRQLERKHANVGFNAELLRKLYVENSVVDIHFSTTLYLDFLQTLFKRPSINNNKLLLSLFNADDLDNAFFSGEYMLYGNGKDYFYPLSSIDVCGHELGHGLIQATAGLEYKAESGALNESYADVLGTAFEFYCYNKFNKDDDQDNDLQGVADWLCGEDFGKQIKYLRNLKDPHAADIQQPKKYKGRYWVDTRDTSQRNDYGGVHRNSGVGNFCYYLLSQETSVNTALVIYYNCLLKLNRSSNYFQFRDTLLECTPDQLKDKTKKCLETVGLVMGETVPRPDPRPQPTGPVPYPNKHIPFIRNLCCPHCLCLQRRKRLFNEHHPGVSIKRKRSYDISSSDNESDDEFSSSSSPSPEPRRRLRRSKRLRKKNDMTHEA